MLHCLQCTAVRRTTPQAHLHFRYLKSDASAGCGWGGKGEVKKGGGVKGGGDLKFLTCLDPAVIPMKDCGKAVYRLGPWL